MKLGKAPATPLPTDLQFARYRTTTLPTPPDTFGLDHVLAPDSWGFLGNDKYGDCVWAGAGHETIVLTGRGDTYGQPAQFTDQGILAAYAACTGFDPVTGANDNGTNVHDAMRFRQKTGIQDVVGKRHTIGAYISLEPGNLSQLAEALYLFECVGIGIEFPQSARAQFNAGERWSVVPGSPIDGGHYVPLLSRQGSEKTWKCVTWGRLQTMTDHFIETYCDEAWCYVTTDAIEASGETFRGFDMVTLQADLSALSA